MKKLLVLFITLVLALTGCTTSTDNGGSDAEAPKDMTIATSREVSSMDYVITALATDHEINVNLVDGLLEHDTKGAIVSSIASTWSANEDATVWTFNLRPDVKWVTNTGEEYATVVAEDFVTGLRHGAEFKSGTAWLLQGVITGYSEYYSSDYSDEAFANVGVKAIDDLTLEFTLENPTPYFDSMTTYAVLYPINKTFLESQGEGCKLGAPVVDDCSFGSLNLDSILYNGAYILTTNDAKSSAVLTKNEAYWDAENVHLDTVTRIYDDGSDPYSVIKGFEQGTYAYADLMPGWEDYATYAETYSNNTYFTLSNSYTFGLVFNYNRQVFNETNYADDTTLRDNTAEAIHNVNFRNALKYAMDRTSYLATRSPLELATATLRNVHNFPAAGTQSDGTQYYDLVEKHYADYTGETIELEDGQDPYNDKDKALAYIEAAKAEGIEFPVHLDLLVNQTSVALTNQALSLKQAVEEATDGQIIIETVFRDEDTVENIVYYNQDPSMSDYDISTYTGWGPDYQDPKSFVDVFSPTTGYYMTNSGLGTMEADGVTVADLEAKESAGFMEYERLYREADAITDDMDARYDAFAKADAYLIANSIYIPVQQQTRGQRVSYIVPFSQMYAATGTDNYKYKGWELQTEIVTQEQYAAAEAAWK